MCHSQYWEHQDFESLSIHSLSCDGERPRSGILASFLDGGPPRRRAEYHCRHQVSFLQWIKTAHQAYVRASNLPMMRALLTHILPENLGSTGTTRNSDGQNASAGSSSSLPSLSLLPSFWWFCGCSRWEYSGKGVRKRTPNGLRERGQAKQVEGWTSSADTRISRPSTPNSIQISPKASTLTQGPVVTMYLQHRQGPTVEQEFACSDASSRRAGRSRRISLRSPHQYQVTTDMVK